MARPGLLKHRKFIRLSRILRSRYRAYGVLGLLWEAGYESGEPIIGDEADVEAVCDWDGEPGELVAALQSCGGAGPGFIVLLDDGRFEVHDFWTHAPTYVRRRAEREVARQRAGLTLSEIRAAAGRLGAAAKHGKRLANDRQFATTPISQLPNTKASGFASPDAEESVVVAVSKRREETQFSNTTTATRKARSAKFEGTADQMEFMSVYNDIRMEIPGMSQESLTENLAPALQELLDYASKKLDDPRQVIVSMIRTFLRSKMDSKRLSTLLNPEVWMARFDGACSEVEMDLERLQSERRKRRYS